MADLCAAPGGKSIELSRNASKVFSSDVSLGRVQRVIDNAQRLEVDSLFPYVADARASRPFDRSIWCSSTRRARERERFGGIPTRAGG